jgi:hypothetical protein
LQSFRRSFNAEPNHHLPLKNSQTLALVAAGAVAFSLLNKANAAGTLNFYPLSVTGIQMDGSTPVMTLGIRVQNTSGSQYVMRSIAGNAYSNNYLVGNFSSFAQQSIPANYQATIYITIRLSLIGIVQDILNAFQYHNFTQTVTLQGYANVDNYQVPINLSYQVG